MRIPSLLAIGLTVLLASSCKSPNEETPGTTTKTIETGESTTSLNQPITSGTYTVERTGDPLNGLSLRVPSGAHPGMTKTYQVTSATITSHKLGSNFRPISPLITIRNGGGYADQPVEVRIPVHIPSGEFAMVFAYDDKTGKLEGIPSDEASDSSITILTEHFSHSETGHLSIAGRNRQPSNWTDAFSSFVVSSIPQELLGGPVTSGFLPGVDDWQYANHGSVVAHGGHCSGQSFSMLWYYTSKKTSLGGSLFGRYDNDGLFKTQNIWEDDVKAYRLSSVVQKDYGFSYLGSQVYNWQHLMPSRTYNLFKYALLLTHEPQYIYIASEDNKVAHAMVIYGATSGALQVCDPNYPGNRVRAIEYAGGQLRPYASTLNRNDTTAIMFTQFRYIGTSSLVHYDKIQQRWSEFEAGTIGDGLFPAYLLTVEDEHGDPVELPSYFRAADGEFIFDITGTDGMSVGWVYDSSGHALSATTNRLSLPKGIWKCGLTILKGGDWADFRWVLLRSDRSDETASLNIDGVSLQVDSIHVYPVGASLWVDLYTPGSPKAGWVNMIVNDYHEAGTYQLTGLNSGSWESPGGTYYQTQDPASYLTITIPSSHEIRGQFEFTADQFFPTGDGVVSVSGEFSTSQ